jgi:predicted transcriptional regulator
MNNYESASGKNPDILALAITNQAAFRDAALTSNQIQIMKMIIQEGCMMTRHLMEIKSTSPQNASGMLQKLFHKGYLHRCEVVAETGGIEHQY